MGNELVPMKMIASFKNYLWDGENLAVEFGKNTAMRPLAESWEVSCHSDGPSKIATGAFVGSELKTILEKHPEMIGENFSGQLPILIKLIDAKQSLSLQVHPDNKYAPKYENQLGKNEMWYVIDALPGAEIIVGFNKEVSKEEIRKRIENNSILEVVDYSPVKAGDCFEIPAGMLHAIGEGVVIVEVQQSSNVTYRVYDYDRRDTKGNLRELHIDKAIDVIKSDLKSKNCGNNPKIEADGYSRVQLTDWDWFNCQQLEIKQHANLEATKISFQALVVVEGNLTLDYHKQKIELNKGDSVFVPAGAGKYQLIGQGKVILTSMTDGSLKT